MNQRAEKDTHKPEQDIHKQRLQSLSSSGLYL